MLLSPAGMLTASLAGLSLALALLGTSLWPPLDRLSWAFCAQALAWLALTVNQHRRAEPFLWAALAAFALSAAAAAWPFLEHLGQAWRYGLRELPPHTPRLAAIPKTVLVMLGNVPRLGEYWSAWLGLSALNGVAVYALALHLSARRPPWRAGYMLPRDVEALAANREGLALGLSQGRILRYCPNPKRGWLGGHHLLLAGTRAGKGVSALIPAILDHDGPVVVVDIKGELAAVTAAHRARMGRRVIKLNPYHLCGLDTQHLNPLDYVRPAPATRARDVQVIADGCVRTEHGDNSHFSEMARQLLAAAIEVACRDEEACGRTLQAALRIVLSANAEETIVLWSQSAALLGPRVADTASVFLQTGQRERGAILTTLRRNTAWLQDDAVSEALAHSDFHFDELIAGDVDLYICVPLDQLEAQANLLRLMVNLVLGAILREAQPRLRKKLLMVLDETPRLGRMQQLLSLATVSAGYGVEAMFVTQDIGSLRAVWGDNEASTIAGACATVRAFGLGRTDSASAEFLAACMGSMTIQTQSDSLTKARREISKSTSVSETAKRLISPDELLEMVPDEMICLIRSKPPIRLKRIISHTHPAYQNRLSANPFVQN